MTVSDLRNIVEILCITLKTCCFLVVFLIALMGVFEIILLYV